MTTQVEVEALKVISNTEVLEWLVIEPQLVQTIFKKATGPEGLPAFLLKNCSSELTAAWCPIFQKSLNSHTVPALWKKSIITPVPKVSCPSTNNDFRPIALTSVVIKCFERVIGNMLKSEVASNMDPLQFAYRQGWSTDDAIISVTHLISKHLEDPKAYARVLFADFSSAFNTLQPHLLIQKLNEMHVNTFIIKWFYSFLTNRSQQVKVNSSFSEVKYCSTGVPQGCVSSPILFTLYTNDCRSTQPKNHVIKFSDHTIILSLLRSNDCPLVYYEEIASFKVWCDNHHLTLNTEKTREIIFDPREVRVHDPVTIGNCEIEQVCSHKYLGIIIDNNLKWSDHVDHLCLKLAQRTHFLRRLRLFGVDTEIMLTFYNAVLYSILRYGLASWYGTLSVHPKAKIASMIKIVMKVMGKKEYPSLLSTYESVVVRQAQRILKDPTHTLYHE
ncbi:hypothetical protein LDENG_00007020 [Lucifuga dentata]|nr:hypothetical protein LDENG_00007020 [Lucifuga dentata]